MTNHNNTATLCEIRNSVKILLEFLQFYLWILVKQFVVTGLVTLVYAVGGYWIIT